MNYGTAIEPYQRESTFHCWWLEQLEINTRSIKSNNRHLNKSHQMGGCCADEREIGTTFFVYARA